MVLPYTILHTDRIHRSGSKIISGKMIWWLFTLELAAFFSACSDILHSTPQYDNSIFTKWSKFCDPRTAFSNNKINGKPKNIFAGNLLAWWYDGFHLSKLLMLTAFFITILIYKPIFGYFDIFILFLDWFVPFELSRKFLLRK